MKHIVKNVLMLAAMLMLAANASAYDFEVDRYYYNILSEEEKTVELAGYRVSTYDELRGSFAIPGRVIYEGAFYTVTSIGERAVTFSNITSVSIPESVTSIGAYAFAGCKSVTSMKIPDGVTFIGEGAFQGCGFTEIKIPDGVTSIGANTFFGCDNLTSVELPDGVTSIGDSAFYGCEGLTSIELPNGVASIGDSAFYGCEGLASIELPAGITAIEDNTFYGCDGLTSITIPDNVVYIGMYAFRDCRNLASVTIGRGVKSIGLDAFMGEFDQVYVEEIYCLPTVPPVVEDGFGYEFVNKVTVYVDAGCGEAYRNAKSWSSIKNIIEISLDPTCFEESGIYYNVLSEEEKTVEVTKGVNEYTGSVTIPNEVTHNGITYSVEAIGVAAFSYCMDLRSVSIPSNVTSVGAFAFSGCEMLVLAALPERITEIGDYTFSGCKNLMSAVVPESVMAIGNNAFNGCARISSIVIPDNVTSIGNSAFENCTGLTSVEIGSGLVSIGESVFKGCSKLVDIVIPDNVGTIGDNCFYGCTGLTSVEIGSGVTSIGESVFRGCSKLVDIVIPDNVGTIGDNCFYGCSGLASVEIGSGVVSIGASVFTGCSKLATINVSKDNRSYVSEDGVLYNMDMTELLRYPAGKMEQSFDIPSTVTTVAAEAFSDSYIFYSVTIPVSVTTIGDNAFSGCNGLKEITSVSPTPPAISANTFDSSHYSNAQLIIPVGATVDYLMADNWYNFINIKEMELSGVDEVAEACVSVAAVDGEIVVSGADDSVVDVYSIGGQLLYSGMDTTVGGLAHGIYIVRVAGQTFKVSL